jgi:C4-dicarboxylate transporter DctM subunit
MGEVSAGVWPFLVIMLLSVLLIFFWPALVLYIPFHL